MKKLLTCMMMLLTSTLVFADDWKWDEKTRDAAYEAPNSKFQKKWYINDQNETTYQFGANGVVTLTLLVKNDHFDVRIVITLTGKYTRNKDHLNITWTGVQTKPNQTDMDALSARNRDNVLQSLKSIGHHFTSKYKNKTEYFLILRLDDECLIITKFDPQSKLFNDFEWTTLFNESHKKKEEERAAQLAVEKARQDSIRQVQEAEAKARREAEEKAKREAVDAVNEVFDHCEQMPSFPGGDLELMKFLHDHMKYPAVAEENGIQGRVIVNFIVERDGSISNAQIQKSVDPSLDKEAIRLIKSMPRWIPGKQDGIEVRAKYTVPVTFRLR